MSEHENAKNEIAATAAANVFSFEKKEVLRGRKDRKNKLSEKATYYDSDGKFDPQTVAEVINVDTPLLVTEREIYAYENDVFKPITDKQLSQKIFYRIESINHRNNYIAEVMGAIKRKFYVKESELNYHLKKGNGQIVCLQNCLLNAEKRLDYFDNDPRYKITRQINVKYSLTQTEENEGICLIKEYLLRIFGDYTSVLMFEEFVANMIFGGTKFPEMLILVGGGGTGKSTALGIVKMLLGEGNYTSIPLHRFSDEDCKFVNARLDGDVLANIHGDLPKTKIRGIGNIKEILDFKEVEAEKKGVDGFTVKPIAKHLYACNEFPDLGEYDRQTERRLLFITCDKQIQDSEMDRDLLEKLTHPEELTIWFHRLLDARDRLYKNNAYTQNEATLGARRKYLAAHDIFNHFKEENLEDREGAKLKPMDAWNAFRYWCREIANISDKGISNRKFYERMEKGLNYQKRKTSGYAGDGIDYYIDVTFSEQCEWWQREQAIKKIQ